MSKISLNSVLWEDKSRHDYLAALEEHIFGLPLDLNTSILLNVLLPYGLEKDNQSATLLFHLLDKGVIFYGSEHGGPRDWSNTYDMWNDTVKSFAAEAHCTVEELQVSLQKALHDVNMHLDGFSFTLTPIAHAWLFGYLSEKKVESVAVPS